MSACTCPCPECGSPGDYAELAKAARVLQADLDAAQNEIERSITDREEQRELIDAQQPVVQAAITYASMLVSDKSPSAKLDAHADLLRSVRALMQQAIALGVAT